MHADLREAIIASVRRRFEQGDCPTEPAHTVETLEHVILDLARTPPAGGDAGAVEGFILFYRPPCGKWYVHSHKIYLTVDDAQAAVDRFLHPKTPFAIRAVAALALPAPVAEGERWRHVKRGTVYEVIGAAELQASKPQIEHAELVIYRGEDGKLWARNSGEFHDGRFAALSEGRSQRMIP